ncbi:EboA domain-containing protein [Streptomyces sp. ST1015]|uniref:EboA domain-containing protein n=1 Tax=unclassified Streptomyces TaxID=2593676 RepID=UPI00223B07B1|nr:EboA domain-containing protein [Streptomyces sp. ST1015]
MATAHPIPQAPPDPRPALAGAPLPDRARTWLDTATARVAADPTAIRALFPAARRQCGQAPLTDHWHTDDAVRAALLTALPLRGEALADAVADLYRHGDPAEQRAVLRALPLLEEVNAEAGAEWDEGRVGADRARAGDENGFDGTSPSDSSGSVNSPHVSAGWGDPIPPGGVGAPFRTTGRPVPDVRRPLFAAAAPADDRLGELALSLVREALRGNDNSVIEAALGAYAAARLPDAEYRQAVLKCVFYDIPLDRLYGLDARADRELARMLADFAHERIAAGRTVPADVWPLVRAHTALAKSLAARARDLAETRPEAAARALAALAETERDAATGQETVAATVGEPTPATAAETFAETGEKTVAATPSTPPTPTGTLPRRP